MTNIIDDQDPDAWDRLGEVNGPVIVISRKYKLGQICHQVGRDAFLEVRSVRNREVGQRISRRLISYVTTITNPEHCMHWCFPRHLIKLDLTVNMDGFMPVNAEGEMLISSLSNLHALRVLWLSVCVALVHRVNLGYLPSLTRLHVESRRNRVGLVLRECPQLSTIDLRNCYIADWPSNEYKIVSVDDRASLASVRRHRHHDGSLRDIVINAILCAIGDHWNLDDPFEYVG